MNTIFQNVTKLFCILSFCLFATSAMAQPVAEVNKMYLDTIKEYAKVTNFAENAAEVAAGKFKVDLENDPKYASIVTDEFVADLQQFFYEIFISEDTIKELAKIYSNYFSLDEMAQLIIFSKSPLGAKMVDVGPALMVKTQQLGIQLVEEHEKEFVEVLAKHIKRVHRGGE